MESEEIKVQKSENIAVLTFNRPDKYNSMTMKYGTAEFPQLVRNIKEDDDIRVLVITGTGKAFCTGVDVNSFTESTQGSSELKRHQKLQPLGAVALELYNLDKPVIAAINGIAAGGGVSIVMLSDIRIASVNAKFNMVFVGRGLIPDVGLTFTMPRLVGTGKSFELMYSGSVVDAEEAERIGLVTKVVPHERLMDETMLLARKLASGPALALAQTRRAIHAGMINNLEQQLYFETYAQNFCFGTEDFKEGLKSFIEKCPPSFEGR